MQEAKWAFILLGGWLTGLILFAVNGEVPKLYLALPLLGPIAAVVILSALAWLAERLRIKI